jgi:Tol biopolymer transport system component
MSADGSGEAEQVTFSEINRHRPTSWSRNGILAFSQGQVGVSDIWVLPMEDNKKPEPFLATRFTESGAQFSPDGTWIAFTSDRSGQDEVYVKPFTGPENMIQISTDGGKHPVWARNSKELFYRNGNQMMAVPIQIYPIFEAGTPTLLFEGSFSYGYLDWSFSYDISPDGKRFVMAKKGDTPIELNVVLNWFEEIKRKVPAGK